MSLEFKFCLLNLLVNICCIIYVIIFLRNDVVFEELYRVYMYFCILKLRFFYLFGSEFIFDMRE